MIGDPDALTPLARELLVTSFAPFEKEEERFAHMRELLEALPIKLAEANTLRAMADPIALEIAAEVADAITFDGIAAAAKHKASPTTARGVHEGAERARIAVRDYGKALRETRVLPIEVLGRDRFNDILKSRSISYDADDLEEIGEERFRKLKEQRGEAFRKLVGFDDVRTATRSFAEPELESRRARDFLGERGLAPIPEETLESVATPAFMRPRVAFSEVIPTQPGWPVHRSLVCITRPTNGIRELALHLQACFSRGDGLRGLETRWGWAHFLEAFLHAHGFGERARVLNDSVWRALLLLIDIRYHSGRMSRDEAAQALVDEVGMPKDAAYIETRNLALQPTAQLSHALGKHMIREKRPPFEALLKNASTPLELLKW